MAIVTTVYVVTLMGLLILGTSGHPQTIPGMPWWFESSVTVDMTMEYLSYSGNFIQLCHVAVSFDRVGVGIPWHSPRVSQ